MGRSTGRDVGELDNCVGTKHKISEDKQNEKDPTDTDIDPAVIVIIHDFVDAFAYQS